LGTPPLRRTPEILEGSSKDVQVMGQQSDASTVVNSVTRMISLVYPMQALHAFTKQS